MIWLWGMCSCSFLRGCFGQTGNIHSKEHYWNEHFDQLYLCCAESFIYRLCSEKSSSDLFHFLEVKVTVHQLHQSPWWLSIKCLSTGHCDTCHHYGASQQFVSTDERHSHSLCGFRKPVIGKNMRKYAEVWLPVWDKLLLNGIYLYWHSWQSSWTRGFWLIKPMWLTMSCLFFIYFGSKVHSWVTDAADSSLPVWRYYDRDRKAVPAKEKDKNWS